ncbi:MAG: DUF6398 domain-containing protein [Thermoleophilia bacterium]
MSQAEPYRVPRAMRARYEAIIGITDRFCKENLNEEYAELSRKLTAALSRKRPSPLNTGRERSWAAGIIYALGQINFLFDKGSEPYLTATDLCAKIEVSQGTASRYANQVRDRADLWHFHPDWCLRDIVAESPLLWIFEVDGLLVDLREMPRELQEEAFRLGLIPFVP